MQKGKFYLLAISWLQQKGLYFEKYLPEDARICLNADRRAGLRLKNAAFMNCVSVREQIIEWNREEFSNICRKLR